MELTPTQITCPVKNDYSKLLDGAGKLVSGFGIVLGVAYLAGWVYLKSYYQNFNASWVMGFLDAPTIIQSGLIWSVYCLALAVLVFFSFKGSEDIRLFGLSSMFFSGLFVVIATAVSEFFPHESFVNRAVNSVGPYLWGLYTAFILAGALRASVEQRHPTIILGSSILGLILMVGVSPLAYAYSRSVDVKFNKEAQTVLSDSGGLNRGMVLGVVAGKVLVSECGTHDVYFVELSTSMRFKDHAEFCN